MGAASVGVSIKHIYEKQYHSQDIEDARYKAQYHVSRSQPQSTHSTERAIVATTDPQMLPDTSTWYLVTNLPAPTECPGTEPPFPPASLEEVIRLYGLACEWRCLLWLQASVHCFIHTIEECSISR